MLIAMTAAALGLLAYTALCMLQPFARCRKCGGDGETHGWLGTRTCGRCHGHRYRLRVGRRLHNAWRRTYRDGTR